MSDSKERLIELLKKLPPERVVELVEFAEFLESKERRNSSKNRDEILAAYGAFREALPSTESFRQKSSERLNSRTAVTYVADACAIIALLRGEQGGDKMRDLILDNSSEARIHAVNLGEVYYLALRRDPVEAAKAMEQVPRLGIQIRRDLDDDFIRVHSQNKRAVSDEYGAQARLGGL